MPARRFFVRDVHQVGEVVAIEGSDARKIARVLRLKSGDEIELVDSAGALFAAALEMRADYVAARLVELRVQSDAKTATIDVAQSIPKGRKMEYVVEKLSELGARALIPVQSERTIVQGAGSAKIERWRRIARSSAQQSGRRDVMIVADTVAFDALCERMCEYDVTLLLWEIAAVEPLRERLPGLLANARTILIVVGPEGGFSHIEAEAAQAAGACTVSLGSHILRTETAGLVAVAIVMYEVG
jgi:16S rRNA (uracil1498-N3)-methyltransferase